MSNKELRSLVDVWRIVGDRRLESYDYKGILYFERDEEGVVQERYFSSFDLYEKEYPTLNKNRPSLIVDLSRRQEG